MPDPSVEWAPPHVLGSIVRRSSLPPEPVEFAVAPAEPRVRVVGLPDPGHLPPPVSEALIALAQACRDAYGMGVEVTAESHLDEVRDALELIRRRLDL